MVRLQASSTIAQQVGVDTVEQSIPTPQVQQTPALDKLRQETSEQKKSSAPVTIGKNQFGIPQSATSSEINQAHRLILKGKESAAFGDSKMLRIIGGLNRAGIQDVKTIIRNREFARQDQIKSETTYIDPITGLGSSVIPGVQQQFYGSLPQSIKPNILDFKGQPKVKQELAWEKADPSQFGFTAGFKRDPIEATKAFITQTIPETVTHGGQIIGGLAVGDTSYWKKYDPTRVFRDVGGKAGEQKVYIPDFGTVTTDSPMGVTTTTSFNLLGEQRVESGVSPYFSEAPTSLIADNIAGNLENKIILKYQKKVSEGSITAEEATVEAQKEFKEKFKIETKDLGKLEAGSLLKRSGERISDNIKTVAVVGGFTALGLSPTGAVVGSALEIGTGAFYATKGSEKIKRGETAEGIMDIGIGSLFATTGAIGLGSVLGTVESRAVKKEFSSLFSSKIVKEGEITVNEKTGIAMITAEQRSGDLKVGYKIFGKIIKQNDKVSFMPSGKVLSTTSGKLDTNVQREFLGEGGSRVLSGQSFDIGSTSISLGKFDDYLVSLQKSTIIPEGNIGLIYSARDLPRRSLFRERDILIGKVGKTKELPDILRLDIVNKKIMSIDKKFRKTAVIGGEESTSHSLTVTRKIATNPKGEDFFATTSTKLGIKDGKFFGTGEEFGIIKQITSKKELTGLEKGESTINKIIGGLPKWKKTPASKTFGFDAESIVKQSISETKTKQKTFQGMSSSQSFSSSTDVSFASKGVKKSLSKLAGKQSSTKISPFTGLGMYEMTGGSQVPRSLYKDPTPLMTVQSPKLVQRLDMKQYQGISQKSPQSILMKTQNLFKQKQPLVQLSSLVQQPAIKTKTETKMKTISAFKQPLKTKQKADYSFGLFNAPASTTPVTPIAPIPSFFGFGVSFNLPFGASRIRKKKEKQGYIPQAKSKGGKWITLSSKPLSRSSALSRGSRAVDQTLSAQFRVKKSKGKVSQGIDNYFGVTKHKYRPYKVRKGQKVELINHLIEKRGSRIDTQGEKSGLSLAKFAKQRGWLPKAKKKKRSKKNGKAKKKSN